MFAKKFLHTLINCLYPNSYLESSTIVKFLIYFFYIFVHNRSFVYNRSFLRYLGCFPFNDFSVCSTGKFPEKVELLKR